MSYTKSPNASYARFILLAFLVAGMTVLMPEEAHDAPGTLLATTPPEALAIPKALSAEGSIVASNGPAAHLIIPEIGVDAVVKDMGLTPDGAMAVPGNQVDVGWFSLGTRPGEEGSAVIGGHNRYASGPGAFANLSQLQKGDTVAVLSPDGSLVSFVVRDTETYDATDTDTGIFESTGGAHLNLITCSGEWDPATKSFTKRLVVFTDEIGLAQG